MWKKEEGYIARIQNLEQKVADLQTQLQSIKQAVSEEPISTPAQDVLPKASAESRNLDSVEIKKPEKKKEPSKTLKVDDNKILEGIQKAWPKVISSLKSKGKINLHTFIQIGRITPAKVEKNKLYLINNGEAVFEEMILAEKHTIEQIIREVANIDITLKGFIAASDIKDKSSSVEMQSTNTISDEEFCQEVVDFFGEDIVTFKDE